MQNIFWCSAAAAAAAILRRFKSPKHSCLLLLLLLLLLHVPAEPAASDEGQDDMGLDDSSLQGGEAMAEYPQEESEGGGPQEDFEEPSSYFLPGALDVFVLSPAGIERNILYGQIFQFYLSELVLKWSMFRKDGLTSATIRTEFADLTGFAACAELNLEIGGTWMDEATKTLGYRWLIWPSEHVGSDLHLRDSIAILESRIATLTRALVDEQIQVPANFAACSVNYDTELSDKRDDLDKLSFAVTEDSGKVLARLSYGSVMIVNNKLVSYPEFELDTDKELCSMMMLRALLSHGNLLGLTEVRIRVDSTNIPLLKAASSVGFRPSEVTMHNGKAHHIFVANPRVPEPQTTPLKERVLLLNRLARELSASYFQILAKESIRLSGVDISGELQKPEVAKVPVHPKKEGEPKPEESLELSKDVKVSLFLSGFGAMALLLLAAFAWKTKKSRQTADRARLASQPLSLSYDDEVSPPTPLKLARTDGEVDAYWGSSSQEAEDWQAGMLDG